MQPALRRRPRAHWGIALFAIALGCLPATESAAPAVVAASVTPVVPLPIVIVPELPPEATADRPPEEPHSVIMVVLDGTRWQDVFGGADPVLAKLAHVDAPSADELMPCLHAALGERGAVVGAPGFGPPMTASGPNFVSLPGYNEIFGGRIRHGCADNECPVTRARTVFDEVRSIADGPEDVAVFASWDRIARAATADEGQIVLSTGRSRLSNEALLRQDASTVDILEQGRAASAYPGKGDFRPDRFTAALALRYLETRRPRILFVGLGEPDEFAHRGDYGGYLDSLRAADRFIGNLFAILDRMDGRGRETTVFVTADHGRARDYRFHGGRFPESSRVWMVAAGAGISARGTVWSARPHHLADIAPTVRRLFGLPPDQAASAGAPFAELFGGDVPQPAVGEGDEAQMAQEVPRPNSPTPVACDTRRSPPCSR